jgi:hypothetical protein
MNILFILILSLLARSTYAAQDSLKRISIFGSYWGDSPKKVHKIATESLGLAMMEIEYASLSPRQDSFEDHLSYSGGSWHSYKASWWNFEFYHDSLYSHLIGFDATQNSSIFELYRAIVDSVTKDLNCNGTEFRNSLKNELTTQWTFGVNGTVEESVSIRMDNKYHRVYVEYIYVPLLEAHKKQWIKTKDR